MAALRSFFRSLRALTIFLGVFCILGTPASSMTDDAVDALWRQFRDAFPNHLQVTALSARDNRNERVMLISEPPPWFGGSDLSDALRDYFGSSLRRTYVKEHPVGVDGWVRDVLIRFESRPGDEDTIKFRLDRINRDLFGTTYKTSAIRLPVAMPADPLAPPNLMPRAIELRDWLLGGQVRLTSLTGGERSQLEKLLCNGKPDTYFSDTTGLVVLLLPTDTPIDPFLFTLRHFAIDTDAILGAIGKTGCNRVAIVGRERTTSLIAMPPLRTEVILRLAATKQKELGQSYERTAPLAGKLLSGEDAGLDWAPIFLSDDLLNTEFGSLLNITDQMLKSWSEAGNIEYERFRYPKPKSFPFEKGAASYVNTEGLTYNWNTTGVGSVVKFGDVRVFALLNTGALPVSYFPEGASRNPERTKRAREAEDIAYAYFRGLRDPNLAAVVELTALYQIFRIFPVQVARDEQLSYSPPSLLSDRVQRTRVAIGAIADGSAAIDSAKVDRMVLLEAANAGVPTDFALILSLKELPPDIEQRLKTSPKLTELRQKLLAERVRITQETNLKVAQVRSKLARLAAVFSGEAFELLSRTLNDRSATLDPGFALLQRLARPGDTDQDIIRKVRVTSGPDRDLALIVLLRMRLEGDAEFFVQLQEAMWWTGDVEQARKQYQTLALNTPQPFIKTPTIVLSANSRELLSTGGHNLYSHSTAIVIDAAVPKGTVVRANIGKDVELHLNPGDVSGAQRIARAFERNSAASERELSTVLNASVKDAGPTRNVAAALEFASADVARTERGASDALQGDLPLGLSGWKLSVDNNSTLRAVQRAEGQYQVEIEKDGASYIFHRLIPDPPRSVRVLSSAEFPVVFKAMAEQVANSNAAARSLVVRTTNLSKEEVDGLAKTLASGGGGRGTRFGGGSEFYSPDRGPWSAWWFRKGGADRYVRRTRAEASERMTVLELTGKTDAARASLREPLDWSRATIEKAATVAADAAEFRGMASESWNVTIPVSARPASSITARITAFFKKVLSQAERDDLQNAIKKSAAENAKTSLSAVDGIAELKADILVLAKSKPEAIRFHFYDGSNDILIAKVEGADRG